MGSNEEPSYTPLDRYVLRKANGDTDVATRQLAQMLRDAHKEKAGEVMSTGMYSDLLTRALNVVNRDEIAQAWVMES